MWSENSGCGRFSTPKGPREINELHVPIDKDIKLIMTSQDVIHSFFIPAFRIKQDVLPGRYTTVWFRATQTGTYHLFCAQFCGTEHSGMIGEVMVMDAGRLPDMDVRRQRRRLAGTERPDAFSAVRMFNVPPI